MSLINRYSITTNGSMIFTGNTLGLTNNNQDIAAFITLDLGQQVVGFPPGTTLLWQDNESSAQLTIPAGATILHAELHWGGTYLLGGADVSAFINDPITFTTPLSGTVSIAPDPATAQESGIFYSRSQDVTALLQFSGSGTYTVGGVPATISSVSDSIGWTLGIVYEYPLLPIQNMNIYTGIAEIGVAAPPLDTSVSGFLSPAAGAVSGRILLSAMEGDFDISGDQVLFGPDTGSLVALFGPNNVVDNFFADQINDGDSESPTVGQLDTRGTFGNINVPTVLPARYGWDITNVESTNFNNSQSEAVLRLSTVGDAYAVGLVGVQLDALQLDYGDAPDTGVGNGVDNYSTLLVDDGPRHGLANQLFLGFQVTAESDGYQSSDALGDDRILRIQDDAITPPLPDIYLSNLGYSIDIEVNNQTGANANLYAWLDFNQDGIFQTNEGFTTIVPDQIGSQILTLNFFKPVTTTLIAGNTFLRIRLTTENLINTGGGNDEDTRSIGLALDGEVEDYLVTIQSNPELTLVKSQDVDYADVGSVISYTIVVQNTGLVDALNIQVTDITPNDTTFIVGSLYVDGIPNGGDLNTGITIPDLVPGDAHLVNFQVVINAFPAINPIPNNATADFENIIGDSFSVTSNTVLTQINHAELIGPNSANFIKSVDLAYADIGDTLTYSFTVENTGNVAATNIILTDTIPNDTTFIPGSVIVVGFPSLDDPETGINLPTIFPGDTISASFQVTIDDFPTPNPIPDTGTLEYQYSVDPSEPPVTSSGDSNTVFTQVNYGDLIGDNGDNFVKSVNLAYADIGDVLTYSFFVENTGNVEAFNIILTDTIPPDTTFVAGSTLVNGFPSLDDPITGIDIPNISAGGSATASFRVTVEALPLINPISDTGTLDYQYLVDPLGLPSNATGDSNTVFTQINYADLLGANFVKSVDLAYADIGDILTYSFTIENGGNVTARNVILIDSISDETTFILDSLLVNGIATGDNLSSGINLPNIDVGEIVTVSFQISIDGIPTPNPISDTGIINYDYIVDPTPTAGASSLQLLIDDVSTLQLLTASASGPSNTVFTQVNSADLIGSNGGNFVKSANQAGVEVGTELIYSYNIENTGSVTATDIVLLDPLPMEVSFVAGSTLINGIASADSPQTGIDIPDILPGGTTEVSFVVMVNELPDSNPMTNIGSISYEYIVDPAEGPVSGGGDSNEVEVDVEVVELQVLKSADKSVAIPGEEIRYTAIVANSGTILAQDLIFTDAIPTGTTFVEDSLSVDGVPRIGESPADGIGLGDLMVNDFITINFTVLVDDPAVEESIINQSTIDYQVQVDPTGGIEDRSQESNEVEVGVEVGQLTIVKMSNVEDADIGDSIIYTIVITNTGTVAAENVIVSDEIVLEASFVDNSVRINGTQAAGVNPRRGIDIGDIDPGDQMVISFEVIVDRKPCPPELINVARADFEFNVEGRGEVFSRRDESNELSVDIELRIFKQLSIDATMEIPSQKPDAEDVLDLDVEVEILNIEVIHIPIAESYEGQNQRGWKIVVEGVLKELLTYVADRAEQDVHAAHFEEFFSTFLITQEEFNRNHIGQVRAVVEDVYVEMLDPRTVFTNITLLLKVMGCE